MDQKTQTVGSDSGAARQVSADSGQFVLHGESLNPMTDAATPLLGMALHVRRLTQPPDVDQLYGQVVADIQAIDQKLNEQGYDQATRLTYRYVLCSFIDEMVLGTDWGSNSCWYSTSLLAKFHNEGRGGEKVFAIITRLESEAERYRELLAFIYLCLCLGFQGRYRAMENGSGPYQKVIARLHHTLQQFDNHPDGPLGPGQCPDYVVREPSPKPAPLWHIFAGFAATMAIAYFAYSHQLAKRTADVLDQLSQLLR